MKHALKRDTNEPEIFKTLKQLGASVYPLHVPCDALVGYRGVTYLVEVKAATGKSTKVQAKFLETWRGQYKVLRTIDEAHSWLNAVGKGITPMEKAHE